ncbi:hypothetical protein CSV75_04540 [Sporosarcina sp. P18a]|uniref:hypothetical protein n=1 Tax=Sporosarcina sp. P18a TaxID=2048259 RepID=UPI000C16D475|nr:hypothetical protein [Sporosarcina sp. P18a]PIC81052.1 hypothetical protein CSV75_04540 [Sporosarcina sp. P18a]
MKNKLKKMFITDIRPVYMIGVSIAGWFTAAMYGFACMIKELWVVFHQFGGKLNIKIFSFTWLPLQL